MLNRKPKDYLGKAKLVAAENVNEAYTTFTGVTRMQQGYGPSGAPLERADTTLGVGPVGESSMKPLTCMRVLMVVFEILIRPRRSRERGTLRLSSLLNGMRTKSPFDPGIMDQ